MRMEGDESFVLPLLCHPFVILKMWNGGRGVCFAE